MPLLRKTINSLEPNPIPLKRFFCNTYLKMKPFSKQGVIFASKTSLSEKYVYPE